jgi:hypothetical protein
MFTTKFTKGAKDAAKPFVKKFAEGGKVPLPESDPRKGLLPEDDPRSEYRQARRDLSGTPPVTILEDLVGRYSPSKGQSNAFRDAIRQRAVDVIKKSGYEDR